jgi:hypothetical protein
MKRTLFTLFSLAFFALGYSQGEVSGNIYTSTDSIGIQGVRVSLIQLPDSNRTGRITDTQGFFRFRDTQAGEYLLEIQMTDYARYRKPLRVSGEKQSLGIFYIDPKAFTIAEVSIQAERAMAQQNGDTTAYNATAFTTNPDANAEDLVAKMPGVVVQNGQVQAQGETVQQVLVDGKPFFGNDPTAALRNLPAQVVDKIQVFDQQSEQAQLTGFDDGNTTKTINIVTKPEMRNGVFGTLYAGYGYGDNETTDSYDPRYSAGGSLNYFEEKRRLSVLGMTNNINKQNFAAEDLLGVASSSGRRGGGGGRGGWGRSDVGNFLVNESGGITNTNSGGFNYSDEWGEKIEVSGSYFFNLSSNVADKLVNQQYFSNESTGQVYTESETSESRNLNHRLNLRLEYKINDNNTLVFRPRLTLQQNAGNTQSTGATSLGELLLNDSDNLFESDLTGMQTSGTVSWRKRFEAQGRSLSVNLSPSYSRNNGENLLLSNLNYYSQPASFDSLNQSGTLFNERWSLRGNVRYTEPIGFRTMLQTFYSYDPQRQRSNQATYAYDIETDTYTDLDTLLSNNFENTFSAHEAGAGIMFRSGKIFSLARVGFQRSTLYNETLFPQAGTVDRVFYNVLPFAIFRYRISKEKNLFALYRSSTNPPSVSQLQEVVDNSNPLQLSTGNAELGQDFQNRLMVRYNSTNTKTNSVLFAMISGVYTHNYIGQSNFQARRDTLFENGLFLPRGAQLSRPVNLDHYVNLRSFLTYGKFLQTIKTNLNLSLSGNYTRTPSLINERLNYAQNFTTGITLVMSSNISENVDFTISSTTNGSLVTNTLRTSLDNRYLNQVSRVKLNLISPGGTVFRSGLDHQLYRGVFSEFNTDYWLWTVSVAQKLFKDRQGEISLSMFDVLRQNNSIQRNVTDFYIEDLQTAVLQRYLLLTFTYQIRQFKGGATMPTAPEQRMGPPGDFRRP